MRSCTATPTTAASTTRRRGGPTPTRQRGFVSRSTLAYVVAGGVTAAVFLLSLLAHEISHAIVARRNELQVEGITLWLLGGVARLNGEAPTPGAEFRIAAVGPFVSLVLGGVFFGPAQSVEALIEDVLMREHHSTFPVTDEGGRPQGPRDLTRALQTADLRGDRSHV